MPTVTRSSYVDAPPDAVWARARTLAGVNDELRPLVRMTAPSRDATIDDAPFTSVMLAGGLLPFDLHFLKIAEVRERGFLERSSSLLQRRWEHERTVEPEGQGSRVTDRVTFEPRLPGAAVVTTPLVAKVFEHRHKRLTRRGARRGSAPGPRDSAPSRTR
jgi:ligand-binding SRPBCC domain-containing protein